MLYRTFILLFCLILVVEVVAQPSNVNQLIADAQRYETEGNLNQAAFHYNKVAFAYWQAQMSQEALTYFSKTLQINQKIGNQQASGTLYNYMGILNADLGNYRDAAENFKKSVDFVRTTGNKAKLANELINLATAELNMGQYSASNQHLIEAVQLAQELNDMLTLRSCYGAIAENYKQLGNSPKSIEYYDMFLTLDKALKQQEVQKIIDTSKNRISAIIAEKQANEQAFDQQLNAANDSLQKATHLSLQRQTQIELLEKQKKLQQMTILERDARLKNQLLIRNMFIAGFVAIGAFSILLYRQYRQKQRTNLLLQKQKDEIEQQKNELTETLKILKNTQKQLVESEKMASLGSLVAGVAHEINTPVGIGITATSNIMDETKIFAQQVKSDSITKNSLKEFLQNTYDTSALVLNNLIRTGELIQSFKQVSVDQSTEQQRKFKLKLYIEDVIRSLQHEIKYADIKTELHCNETLEINSYPGHFAQIITNLVMNSKIHGFKNQKEGTISITIDDTTPNKIKFIYSDNGVGITPDVLPKIYDPFFTTQRQSGTGLGMHIVYNLVTQKLKGTIHCISEPNKGVTFTIEIPV